jgi:hypothetical protein
MIRGQDARWFDSWGIGELAGTPAAALLEN